MKQALGKEIADKLSHAGKKRRGEIVRYYMETYQISKGQVYTLAESGGYQSRKKQRKDKGIPRCGITDDDIKLVAGMQKATKRRNKKMLMPTTVALGVLNNVRKAEGKEEIQVTPSTVNRYLREKGRSRKQMLKNWTTDDHQTPAFCISLKAEFVNEWHVFDITPCIQYYFKPKKGLAQHDQNLELYPGKLENFKKIGAHLHRYVLIDVKSHCYFFKYYYSKGENLADLLDFLYSAWSFKEKFPFCGVPFNLYADKGAANKSQFLRSVADRLGIDLHHHKAGNSRAKGIVEERMKYLQEHFESLMAFRHVTSIEEVNKWSFEFCVMDNATKIHKRMKTTRLARWTSLILPEHKRELKCTREMFMGLAISDLKEATVGPYMSIQFNGEEYYIKGPVNRGEKIWVDYDYLDPTRIRTWKKDADGNKGMMLENKKVTWNKHRERDDAVHIGKEYKRLPDTPVQVAMKEMDTLDYSKIGEVVFGHDLEKIPEKIAYIERQGTEIDLGLRNNPPPSTVGQPSPVDIIMTSEAAYPTTGGNSLNQHCRSDQAGRSTRGTDTKSETVFYPRHDVFKEIRFRLKLERILPVQAELIEKILSERPTPNPSHEGMVEDSVIEEICQLINCSRGAVPAPTPQVVETPRRGVCTQQAIG